jgi:hypothetical protein
MLSDIGKLMSPRKPGTASPPPVVTTYLRDTFTEGSDTALASHVADSGHTWAVLTGNTGVFTVGGGTGDARVTTLNPRYMSSAVTPDDSIIEASIRRLTSVSNDQCGFYFNMLASSTNASITGYRFRFNNATLLLELDKLTASVITQAIISLSYTPASGFLAYKLTKVAGHFEAFVEGVSVATGDDGGVPFVGGRLGLVGGATGGVGTGSHISELYAHN